MEILFGVVGGLGLFLFGMRNMADGLQKAAGDRLKRLLEVLTTNRVAGVLMGAVVTALVQSSSTTTVMVVGFVNAGLMTLSQAVGVIMGANIGTTITAQLIAFHLDEYALPALGIGVALTLFAKSQRLRYIGQAVMGFGMLFLGLEIMKDSLKPLRELQLFRDIIVSFAEHPLLGILAGTGLTVAVQSSSASIGLLQSLAAERLISIQSALPILFGDNIGTTVTAVLSAIGASLAARRAAAVHVIFNLVGAVLFVVALPLVLPVIVASSQDVVRQIANAHTLFNVSNTIIQLPAAGLIVWIVLRLLPGTEPIDINRPRHLDTRFLDTPPIALDLASKETREMATLAKQVVSDSLEGLFSRREHPLDAAFKKEEAVNLLNREITTYLAALSKQSLSDDQTNMVRRLYHTIADVERVGDHGENLAELSQYSLRNKLPFTNIAMEDLRTMADTALKAFDLAFEAWSSSDPDLAQQVFELEKKVDIMEKEMRSGHIERLNRNECHPGSGVIFLDFASNLERVADHAANIAAMTPGV